MEERNYAAEALLLIGVGIFAIVAGVFVLFMVISNNSSAFGVAVIPIIAGSVFVIWGKIHKEKYVSTKEDIDDGKKAAKKWLITFLALFIPLFIIFMLIMMSPKSDSDGKCKFCGREYEGISTTGMCDNCEDNYEDMKQFAD